MSPYAALNPKHQRFVSEYLIDLNGAQAAIRAGYSEGRAKQTANDLLGRDDVKAAVAEKQGAIAKDTGITAERVLIELSGIAFADLSKKPADGAPAISVNDKRKALVDLGKHLGIFKERIELTGKDGEPISPTIILTGRPDAESAS